MGIITIEDNGTYYEFERPDDETQTILRMLTGAKVIKAKKEEIIKQKAVESKTTSNTKDEIKLYNPRSREIMNFILSRPEYKHTTREILAHFNKDIDVANITLSRDNETGSAEWYSILQKLRPIRKKIEKSEHGEWIKDRIGAETEYIFKKY